MTTIKADYPITLTKSEFDWLQLALSTDLWEYEDEWLGDHNLYKDDHMPIAAAEFEDGNTITFDIWSGSDNYWDAWTLYDKDGYDIWEFDPSFEMTDGEIELYCEPNDTTYIVEIKIEFPEED